MSTPHSAAAPALGYFYQVRYALLLILKSEWDNPNLSVEIETLDDVVLKNPDSLRELLQLKHHTSQKASLTNASTDIWKTLYIWCTHLKKGKISLPDTILTLVTTAKASEGSIASLLRPEDKYRNTELACRKLLDVANTSKNKSSEMIRAFETFKNLSEKERHLLVNSIQVLILSPNISDTAIEIKKIIQIMVPQKYLGQLYHALEGWFFDKIVHQLSGNKAKLISKFEVHKTIREMAYQFKQDNLPIYYRNDDPPQSDDIENDNRIFVLQLKIIQALRRIKSARRDYYRAYMERSRWINDELLFDDDLLNYEKILIEKWEDYFGGILDEFELENELSIYDASEIQLKKMGLLTYKEICKLNMPIGRRETEPYVTRGSYHILSNKLRVGWHPLFENLLKNTE